MTTLPNEIWLQVMHQYLGADHDDESQRLWPYDRTSFPVRARQLNKNFRARYDKALRGYLYVILYISTCHRPCGVILDRRSFRILNKKLLVNQRFEEINLDWLQNATAGNFPAIEIRVDCCTRSEQTLTQDLVPTACFPSREVLDRSFTEFLNSVVVFYPRMAINGSNLNGIEIEARARRFMGTVCHFLRNVSSTSFNNSILGQSNGPLRTITAAQSQQIRNNLNYNNGPQMHTVISALLTMQMRTAVELIRKGYPQYLLLPEFLDTANRYRTFFRNFTADTGHDLGISLQTTLMSSVAGYYAFICSALAQYLLTRENTRYLQRHYTMPNRFHDQWIFHSGEQFWTPFLDSLDRVITTNADVRRINNQYVQANPDVWCSMYQAVGELSVAFARAALVAGEDEELLSAAHDDVLPDIRFHTLHSRSAAIRQHQVIERRTESCSRHLVRARRMLEAVRGVLGTIAGNWHAPVQMWCDRYSQIADQVEEALDPMLYNLVELGLRLQEEHRFSAARQQARRIKSRKGRWKREKIYARKIKRLKPMRMICQKPVLTPPFLWNGETLIRYLPPPFDTPDRFIRWPDDGRPFHYQDEYS